MPSYSDLVTYASACAGIWLNGVLTNSCGFPQTQGSPIIVGLRILGCALVRTLSTQVGRAPLRTRVTRDRSGHAQLAQHQKTLHGRSGGRGGLGRASWPPPRSRLAVIKD